MAILDIQRNQQGIQVFNFQLTSTDTINGQGDLLRHSNGSIYSIWAANYTVGVTERRLYMAWSDDQGATWSPALELTSGKWDDNPCLVQLDPTSDESDIGVVCSRANSWLVDGTSIGNVYLFRFTVNLEGTITSGLDAVHTVPGESDAIQDPRYIGVHRSDTFFIITYTITQYANTLYVVKNPIVSGNPQLGFTGNAWERSQVSIFAGADAAMDSVCVRPLSAANNDDVAILYTLRTDYNNSADSQSGYQGRHTPRTNLFVRFADKNLTQFSNAQQLTNYEDPLNVCLEPNRVVAYADLVELLDGSLAVCYVESSGLRALASRTSPAIPASLTQTVLYHATHNLLILTGSYLSSSTYGVWIMDMTTGTLTKLTTVSTPPLYNEKPFSVALSSDDRYLAIGHDDGLSIYDTEAAAIADWTVTELRSTTTPALPGASPTGIEHVAFDGPVNLYFAYQTGISTVPRCWGGLVDVSDISGGIINLMGDAALSTGLKGLSSYETFLIRGDKLITCYSGRILVTDKLTGAGLYSTSLGCAFASYDDVNDLYVCSCTVTGISLRVVRDTGSAFEQITSFYLADTGVITPAPYSSPTVIPGAGLLWHRSGYGNSSTPLWYSFAAQKPCGPVHTSKQTYQDDYLNVERTEATFAGNWMLVSTSDNSFALIDMANSGRLRWGLATYNKAGKQLESTNIDFYDAVNQARLGTMGKQVKRFRMINDGLDTLVFIGQFRGLNNPGRQFGNFIAYLEPDTRKVFTKARILATYVTSLQSRTCIRNTVTRTLTVGARITTMHCLLAKARIVTTTGQGMFARAAIRNRKVTLVPATFNVSNSRMSRAIRLHFTVQNGYTRTALLGLGAYIAPVKQAVVTGHFLVAMRPTTGGSLVYTGTARKNASMGIGARIER